MIITCDKCRSTFELEEGMLKPNGSKVKCSLCKNIFTAYPSGEPEKAETPADDLLGEDLQETVALDSPPVLDEAPATEEDAKEGDFDEAFEEAIEEGADEEDIEAITLDEIPDEAEEVADLEESAAEDMQIGEDLTEEEEDVEATPEAEEGEAPPKKAKPKKKPGRSRLILIILIIILILAAGFVVVFFKAPSLLPKFVTGLRTAEVQSTDPGVRRLSFKGVSGSFIESRQLGQLFVIKGVVTNDYAKGRSFILVRGSILDDKGAVVKRKMAYAGNTFTENRLKEMTLEEINAGLKNRLGQKGRNQNIAAGASIPFMVIIEQLPENVSEFIVEAVSSSPAN